MKEKNLLSISVTYRRAKDIEEVKRVEFCLNKGCGYSLTLPILRSEYERSWYVEGYYKLSWGGRWSNKGREGDCGI